MIHDLKWDSGIFNRKIGELRVEQENAPDLEYDLKRAREEGFEYIMYKVRDHQPARALQAALLGFYLSDICVTWAIKCESYTPGRSVENRSKIRSATEGDIPALQEMVVSMFPDSFFYNDPFFIRKDADRLYQAWIENSVKGEQADIVLYIPDKGFITCKKLSPEEGRIGLVGVRKEFRGLSLGSALIERALMWFRESGVQRVWVRTQLKNLDAMNFYNRSGFYIKEYDMVYGNIL